MCWMDKFVRTVRSFEGHTPLCALGPRRVDTGLDLMEVILSTVDEDRVAFESVRLCRTLESLDQV